MFLATRVRKDSVFNAYFTWEKKETRHSISIDGENL